MAGEFLSFSVQRNRTLLERFPAFFLWDPA